MDFNGWFTSPLCGPFNMHLAPKAKKKNTKIGFVASISSSIFLYIYAM